ncbi:DUF4422 domain-containing protein [Olsenella profusa]|uniref:DUF4422 domain-containing protein n=1 Tax=Olsenella profusa TaxID=138595 RepID=A0ABS2F1E1_9ACTN|nr:DUF4422 domain-containing protein [Olsenella profusa]MBM6774811.1 DUF4422 domain-containing protein [Olsenella profusa]
MPFFSIVIPAYKNEEFLPGCLDSIRSQSFEDWEAIVVVDGSPDDSAQVVRRYERIDPRVKLLNKVKNEGTHLARLSGVDAAQGRYIYLLDADDTLPPDALAQLRNVLIGDPSVDMLHFGINVVGVDINESERRSFEDYINRPRETLEGGRILAAACSADEGYLQDWRVTQRVYSSKLLKYAYGLMTRDRLGRAQDGYEYFVIASVARRQLTCNDIVALNYYYGRGVNGDACLSPEKFIKSARDFQVTIDAIGAYAAKRKDGSLDALRDGSVAKLIDLLMNDWRVRLSDKDKLDVLDELSAIIGADALSTQLMRFVRDDAYAIWCSGGRLGDVPVSLEQWVAAAHRLHESAGSSDSYEAMSSEAEGHLRDIRRRSERWATYDRQPVRIFVSTHKPVDLFDSDILQPVQVGACCSSAPLDFALRDDLGDNISSLNPMYCELTTQYWAWKNVDAEYYGFCHYRRYFDFSPQRHDENAWGEIMADRIDLAAQQEYFLDDESIRKAIEGYDVITTEFKDLRDFPADYATPWEHYDSAPQLHIEDLELAMRILGEMHPDYIQDADDFLLGNESCFCNMFIMRKAVFQDYCSWLFPMLDRFMAESDMSHYSREARRTPGHLAERLLNIYYRHNLRLNAGWKTKQVQCVHFEHPDLVYPLEAFHPDKPLPVIPVVFASDDAYVPMLTTTIYSMLRNASTRFHYDIVVFGGGISEDRQQTMRSFLSRFQNADIRFVDAASQVKDYDLRTNNEHISIETYYRFLIQGVLSFYDKVLYLDSDLIVEGDVSELFSTDLGDNLLAAARDVDYLGNLNIKDGNRLRYSRDVLGMSDPYGYFQAGVLLLNTKALRELCSVEDWLEAVTASEYIYDDQDVLNARCEGRVTYLDAAWNVMTDCDGRVGNIFSVAPSDIYAEYLSARRSPKIMHYAGHDKPWRNTHCDEAVRYWSYARETPFYEELLEHLSKMGREDTAPVAIVEAVPPRAISEHSLLRLVMDPLLPLGSRRREILKSLGRAVRGR